MTIGNDGPGRLLQTRRTLLTGTASAIGAGAVGAYFFTRSISPAAAASITANNQSITTDDGTITDVTLTPDVTVSWSGLDVTPTTVDLVVSVESSGLGATTETIISVSPAIDGPNQTTTGSQGFAAAFSQTSILSNHSQIAASDFTDGTEGDGAKDTTLTVTLDVSVKDSAGNVLASSTAQDSFTVSVTNDTSTTSSTGTAGTSVSG